MSKTLTAQPLTKRDRDTLDSLESIIQRGKKHFLETGAALVQIRDQRLYRESHGTFEAYCEGKWGFKKRQAYRYIEASRAVAEMCPMGHKEPMDNAALWAADQERQKMIRNERAARELAKVKDPAERAEVLADAVEDAGGKPPTAKQVKAAAEKKSPPEITKKQPPPENKIGDTSLAVTGCIGKLIRALADHGDATDTRDGPHHVACLDSLNSFQDLWDEWLSS